MSKTFESSKDQIARLCKYFSTNEREFLNAKVKEAHVRQSLIDPFFEALGWDVRNASRVAPQYREVIPEDSLDVEGHLKAPDYAFRIGTLPKFYVEAKKCGVKIRTDAGPAYQLRRYGWSGKVPISILTDFQEFAAYDCTRRPVPNDKASRARTLYLKYEEYPDRWEEIWGLFSREAVWSGAFDNYAASKRKRGTSEVDAEFLKELESWRELLARNIAIRNQNLTSEELNAAVQLTIDRIVFLRMAEDRGLEPYEQLLKLSERGDIYPRFITEVCRKADEKYNSGLFHFRQEPEATEPPDKITPRLTIDDKVIKPILESLYFSHGSPYHFGALPVEILGTIYERFLGKVIRLTPGHRAKIEDKPEVRKAGGVYYTPAYIVDLIVRNTVRPLVDGKSPAQLAGRKSRPSFKVIDIACGSGSFLLGAYGYLLNHCLDWYTANNPEKWTKAVYQDARSGAWRLTIEEKKRILTAHIFGVDIDAQAVEVAKLSLMLKALEGESDASLSQQFALFHTRALPNLCNNIKCGNSLIDPDYFADDLVPDPEAMKTINAFDWESEFADAMSQGGFDCVIGNPPYLYSAAGESSEYFLEHFSLGQYQTDFYVYFIEKALSLCRSRGRHSFIVSDAWLNSQYFSTLRSHILEEHRILLLAGFRYPVFKQATIENSVYVVEKNGKPGPFPVMTFTSPDSSSTTNELSPSDCITRGLIDLHQSTRDQEIIAKIELHSIALNNFVKLNRGIHAYRTDGYGRSKFTKGPQTKADKEGRVYHSTDQLDETYLPEVRGKDVFRYRTADVREYLSYGDWLAEPRTPDFFFGEKVVVRKVLGKRLSGTYISDPAAIDQSLYILLSKKGDTALLKAILAILLSGVGAWFLRTKHSIHDVLYPWYTKAQLAEFPLPASLEAERHTLASLVDSMMALQVALHRDDGPGHNTNIERQIASVEAKTDAIVYQMYGLSKDDLLVLQNGG